MEDKSSCKIVLKRSISTHVHITPETYEKIIDIIEDYKLYLEAKKRLKNENTMRCYFMKEVMKKYGITQEELDAMEDVEIE